MHWRNSNFQLAYFLAGKCHTPDEAYRVLMQQLEDRETAIAQTQRFSWAKIRRAIALLFVKPDALDKQAQLCIEQALRERDFIRTLIATVQPLRELAHLPDHLAFQMAQAGEWKHEFIFRAENFIATQGFVPADQLAAMRTHPDFENAIAPRMNELLALKLQGKLTIAEKPLTKMLSP